MIDKTVTREYDRLKAQKDAIVSKQSRRHGFNSADLQRMNEAICWPEHWDLAAYPTLWDAIYEIVTNAGCSECQKQ
jgi:hypothetical protein